MRSAPSLAFEPQRSRIAVVGFALIVLLAAVSIALCALPTMLQMILGAVLIAAAYTGARSLRRGHVARAVLQSDGSWLLSQAPRDVQSTGAEITATLVSSSVLGALIALTWQDAATRRHIPIMLWPDSIPSTTRRPLRVWLRSGKAHASDPGLS